MRSFVRTACLCCGLALLVVYLLTFLATTWANVVLRDNNRPGLCYHTLPRRTQEAAQLVLEHVPGWRWPCFGVAMAFGAAAACVPRPGHRAEFAKAGS
jgi:hypothetical protein